MKDYSGYERVGSGACATADDAFRSSGAYKCPFGDTGCPSGVAPVNVKGLPQCPGPDGKLNTNDDDYLSCAETSNTQDDCVSACDKDSQCNGVEYKTASHTGKSVCELHYSSIDGWKDVKFFDKQANGRFPSSPTGRGFRKGKKDSRVPEPELSGPAGNLQQCQAACLAKRNCKAVEYEAPQVNGGKGDCEMHFLEYSHTLSGACYKKKAKATLSSSSFELFR